MNRRWIDNDRKDQSAGPYRKNEFIELDTSTGNKVLKDFLGKIKGKYNARLDITTDFYGRQIAKGDQLMMTLNM